MSVPADSRSIHSTATAVHAFDPEADIPVVLDDKPIDPFLVRFSPGDPENPKVCSFRQVLDPVQSYHPSTELVSSQEMVSHCIRGHSCPRRVSFRRFSIFLPLNTRHSTFSSSAPSPIIPALRDEFGFSAEVGILTISLFVSGYCVGPLLWAPLSEQYGRRPIFIISFFGFLVCHIPIVMYFPHFNHHVIYSVSK